MAWKNEVKYIVLVRNRAQDAEYPAGSCQSCWLLLTLSDQVRPETKVVYPPEAGVFVFCCCVEYRFSPLIKTDMPFSTMLD